MQHVFRQIIPLSGTFIVLDFPPLCIPNLFRFNFNQYNPDYTYSLHDFYMNTDILRLQL